MAVFNVGILVMIIAHVAICKEEDKSEACVNFCGPHFENFDHKTLKWNNVIDFHDFCKSQMQRLECLKLCPDGRKKTETVVAYFPLKFICSDRTADFKKLMECWPRSDRILYGEIIPPPLFDQDCKDGCSFDNLPSSGILSTNTYTFMETTCKNVRCYIRNCTYWTKSQMSINCRGVEELMKDLMRKYTVARVEAAFEIDHLPKEVYPPMCEKLKNSGTRMANTGAVMVGAVIVLFWALI